MTLGARLLLRAVFAAVAPALLGGCRGEGAERADSGVFVEASVYRDASSKDDPSFEFRCEIRRGHPERVGVTVEHHGNMYSFCSRELELETTEPITILQDDGCTRDCEVKQWKLEVGQVQLEIRVDVEWANMGTHGWRDSDIERVVYPEVFGRSARRVNGNTVQREADLTFDTNRLLRVHFRYEAPVASVDLVDEMIDRVHIPMCFRHFGCARP